MPLYGVPVLTEHLKSLQEALVLILLPPTLLQLFNFLRRFLTLAGIRTYRNYVLDFHPPIWSLLTEILLERVDEVVGLLIEFLSFNLLSMFDLILSAFTLPTAVDSDNHLQLSAPSEVGSVLQ
uniref:Uncharacterized protein n=1 Tax=Strombidium inclinatum TaxID=197538 RepID=A0A7S3ITL7_9SPIT